jgi:ufm1-conjugating enzyme 1
MSDVSASASGGVSSGDKEKIIKKKEEGEEKKKDKKGDKKEDKEDKTIIKKEEDGDNGKKGEDGGDGEGEEGLDELTKRTVHQIPHLKTRAGPRDNISEWNARLKEEYLVLIQYVKQNKENDSDWFSIKSNKEGTKWEGKCWYYYENIKYEFGICFDMPITYPTTAPEIKIPELDGKTTKMYHGGKICLTIHFHPLWSKNVPRFGVAHALALGECHCVLYFDSIC